MGLSARAGFGSDPNAARPLGRTSWRRCTERRALRTVHSFSSIRYIRLEDPVALPYRDGYFDTIIAHGVLEHVPDPVASLGELRRVLARGSMLLIDSLPNRYSYTEALLRKTGGSAHERRYALSEIRMTLERIGFDVMAAKRVEMAPMMLSSAGAAARKQYERVGEQIAAVSRMLERPPFDLVATSLFVAARRRP